MPSLLSTDDIREHVDTDLSDTALQRLIDDAEAEIVQRYGAHAEDGVVTDRFIPVRGEHVVYPTRKVDAEQAIVVTRSSAVGGTVETVDASVYALNSSRELRLFGTYGWSGYLIEVTYTPLTDTPRRIRVLIDLVRLAIRYEAASSTRMGDASVNHLGYEAEREALLKRLGTGLGSFA